MRELIVGDRVIINIPSKRWVNIAGVIQSINDGVSYPYTIKLDKITDTQTTYPCLLNELQRECSPIEDGEVTHA